MSGIPASIHGVKLSITGADVWGSLRILNEHGIGISHIQETEPLTVSVILDSKFYPLARGLLTKRGDLVKLHRSSPASRLLHILKRRFVLTAGLLFLLVLGAFLPTRILFIQVEGNERIPTKQILESAAQAGIRFFASRREVRSEKMKNALLSYIPELGWAGVNTYGCRAVISVQEKSVSPESSSAQHIVSNIVAQRDGIIESITVNQGSIQCAEKQAVKKGQLLISGYTDCGICIRASRAEGEVFAQTIRSLRCVSPNTVSVRTEKQETRKRYSIIIGKNRIFFWKDSGIWDATCGRISRQYTLTLPGGMELPVALCCETITSYSTRQQKVSADTAKRELCAFASDYLISQMIAGQIRSATESFTQDPDTLILNAQYICSEMIGRERAEKIGDLYGQNN